MMKFTRPSALHAMGATFQQLQAYTDELSKYLKENTPRGFIEPPKGNGNDPEKKSRSRSRKARKEKKEETEETEE